MATEGGSLRQRMGPVKKRLTDKMQEGRSKIQNTGVITAENKVELRNLSGAIDRRLKKYDDLVQQWASVARQDTDEAALYDAAVDEIEELLASADDVYCDLENIYRNFCDNAATERADATTIATAEAVAKIKIDTDGDNIPAKGKSRIKLPNIELKTYSGGILEWFEFFGRYKAVIHENADLDNVSKFNYLMSKLDGEPEKLLSGLEITETNYPVAISLLKDEYEDEQLAIDLHYSALTKIKPARNIEDLRNVFYQVEAHLRALEALKQDIEHSQFLSMIKSKIPVSILADLTVQRCDSKWTVSLLREKVRTMLKARREAMQFGAPDIPDQNFHQNTEEYHSGTTEGLVAPSYRQLRKKCFYCASKEHYSDQCTMFPDMKSRRTKLGKCCDVCLTKAHEKSACQSKRLCIHCGLLGQHHRSLCPKILTAPTTSVSTHAAAAVDFDEETAEDLTSSTTHAIVAVQKKVIMQLAQCQVFHPNTSRKVDSLVFLDCGSGRSYITRKHAEKLNLKYIYHEKLSVNTFGTENQTHVSSPVVKARMELKNGEMMQVVLNVVPVITGKLNQQNKVSRDRLPVKNDLLALRKLHENGELDILIGNDYYFDIMNEQKIEVSCGLYLVESKLGWILSGRIDENFKNEDVGILSLMGCLTGLETESYFPNTDSTINEKIMIQDLWNLEKIGIMEPPNIPDDEIALKSFNETIKLNHNRYAVTWPRKEVSLDELPQNFELCFGRLKSLIKRLKEVDCLGKYDDLIKDEEKRGVTEKVSDLMENLKTNEKGEKVEIHFTPHKAVYTPGKSTTKVRKVHDASAKSKKQHPSLNDLLYRGPVILEDICALLLRFRLFITAIVADVEKAFHQIELQESERDLVRFLWLKDITKPVTRDNIQIYRFVRVPFGVISSPFLLGATLQYHLNKNGSDTAVKIRDNLYVDNLVTGVKSEQEALTFYHEAKYLFSSASMNLREWLSNDQYFMNALPEKDKASDAVAKVLGIKWDIQTDTLEIAIPIIEKDENSPWTKRKILGIIARIPDLLGFFAPTVLMAKILIQDLWLNKMDWDDVLSSEQETRWLEILKSIQKIPEVRIPRYILTQDGDDLKFELLGFTDASARAMGAAVYLRVVDKDMKPIGTNLVFAKSRLLPKKCLTIPKAELSAAEIGVKCIQYVEKSLHLNIEKKILWTDSLCVLYWLESDQTLSRFVENRLKTLRKSDIEFRYVAGEQNPGDALSRGEDPVTLLNSNHFNGPEWLQKPVHEWPTWEKNPITPNVLEELKREVINSKVENEQELVTLVAEEDATISSPVTIDITEYSSLGRLLRVTAYCNRFIKKLRKETSAMAQCGPPTVTEIADAKLLWELYVQAQNFSKELLEINSNQKKGDLCSRLGLALDKNGVIRCHHRFNNADFDHDTLFPKLLPKNHPYTKLVVLHYHRKMFHAKTAHTLSQIRHEYWIPGGRRVVYSIIVDCTTCALFHAGPYKYPKFPQIPVARLLQSKPFSYSGLDYLGPLYVKADDKTVILRCKVWVCLFTCMVTRAVRLELMMDMSAEEFLLGMRKFISRHKPLEITLDNAPQFKLVKTVTDMAWEEVVTSDEVQSYIANEGITWKFIVANAPWMGGFYERLVGCVKGSLKKAISRKACLSRSQLETLLVESESVVNSRPLVYVGEDFEAGVALTPEHFINGNWQNGLPVLEYHEDGNYIPNPDSAQMLLDSWRQGQKYLNDLWEVFRNEYLLSLRERYQTNLKQKRIRSHAVPKVNHVVLIMDSLPRGSWKMGKIVGLKTSSDGEIRSAILLLSNKRKIQRPINKLCPIETSLGEDSENNEGDTSFDDEENMEDNDNDGRTAQDALILQGTGSHARPTRIAAKAAREMFKTLDE